MSQLKRLLQKVPWNSTKAAEVPPEPTKFVHLQAALKAGLAGRIDMAANGVPGIALPEIAGFIDGFNQFSHAELEAVRDRAIARDPGIVEAFARRSTEANPLKGVPTAEKTVQLLSGVTHGLAPLPTTPEMAAGQLTDMMLDLWKSASAAKAAGQRLGALGPTARPLTASEQKDFQTLIDHDALLVRDSELREARQLLRNVPQGAPRLTSPRVQKLLDDGLMARIEVAQRGEAALGLAEVAPLLDTLLDLTPVELKQIRRIIAPDPRSQALYDALEHNPRKNPVSAEKIIQMLAGVVGGHPPLPVTVEEADMLAVELEACARRTAAPAQEALGALAGLLNGRAPQDVMAEEVDGWPAAQQDNLELVFEHRSFVTDSEAARAASGALGGVPRTAGRQRTSLVFEASLRSGIPGVYSYGIGKAFRLEAVDRHTGKRGVSSYQGIFLKTLVSTTGATIGKETGWKPKFDLGPSWGWVFASAGHPLLGPRAGVFIPLVGSAQVGGNGVIGIGIVRPLPVPFPIPLNVGLNFYVQDPRLLRLTDPILGFAEKAGAKVSQWTTGLRDAVHDLRRGKPQQPPAGLSVNWDAPASVLGEPGRAKTAVGEWVEVNEPVALEVEGRSVDLAFLPRVRRAGFQVEKVTDQQLSFTLDGRAYQVALPPKGALRLWVGADSAIAQIDDGSGKMALGQTLLPLAASGAAQAVA